jgi:hypothetical protein
MRDDGAIYYPGSAVVESCGYEFARVAGEQQVIANGDTGFLS